MGWGAALVFASMSWLYYLAYELVHLAAHLRVGGPWDRVPGLGWLLLHHRRHHAWAVMHHGNFGMLDPVWDRVMGTLVRGRGKR
jgi:sterol desaturase/sphingolipid hydroxylase (fatty acid hydroxylase superfamily)